LYVNVRNVLGFVALAVIASTSWYFARFDSDNGAIGDSQLQGPLGYYLRNADISIMDDDGRMLYRISARTVEERPTENRTVLSDVAIVYSPLAEVPWEIRAESGEIPDAQRYLDLSGSVELATTEASSGETTLIQAPRIRLAPDEYLATTDTDVSVSLGSERLEAVGMVADLKDDYLELESSVHGLFNP
jgi:LPS export ABC transporter protein LptC